VAAEIEFFFALKNAYYASAVPGSNHQALICDGCNINLAADKGDWVGLALFHATANLTSSDRKENV